VIIIERWMHLKVFWKLKKTLKTLSSGQIKKKKKKKKHGWFFFKKPRFFPTLAAGGQV
jgi:hypothetical protein